MRRLKFEIEGKTYSLNDLSVRFGISIGTIRTRYYRLGWNIQDCVSIAPHQSKTKDNADTYRVIQKDKTQTLLHVLIAEMALGKKLPDGAIVHHVNYVKKDNRPENLVICQSQAYHMLIHQRTNAYAACGNASWRKCTICKEYDDPSLLHIYKTKCGYKVMHPSCDSKRAAEYRLRKKQSLRTKEISP